MDYRKELIRKWRHGAYRLHLYDAHQTRDGKQRLAYKFWHEGRLIFKGEDFCCSPMHAIDSDQCVASLLFFLSLRPGDTDREYFDGYTPRQMAFAREEGETLGMLVLEMEEKS